MQFLYDERTIQLHEFWRARVLDAQERYEADRTPATASALRKLLHQFCDLITRGRVPEEPRQAGDL